ncbi:hypothetical protein [Plantactinospora sp. CA-290183]|uniref:hypothetical protein n=1 Tax=Plantactinospora sp. CA-290183 TaxID=3240006 RepID=UPI003D94F12C
MTGADRQADGEGRSAEDAAGTDPERAELIAQLRELAGPDPVAVRTVVADVLAALDRVTDGTLREPPPDEEDRIWSDAVDGQRDPLAPATGPGTRTADTFPVEPRPARPEPGEPHPAEPHPAEPHPVQPRPGELHPPRPGPPDPHPPEPHPAEPHPAEPAPSDPHPAEPGPVTPGPIERRPTQRSGEDPG